MSRLKEDLAKFGIESEGWRETAPKAGRWFLGGQGQGQGSHAEKACCGEERYRRAPRGGCNCDMNHGHQCAPRRGGGKGGRSIQALAD